MDVNPQYCAYYDAKTEKILDFLPDTIDPDLRNKAITYWQQEIPKKILRTLTEGPLTMQELKKTIGHSNSTLHENVLKLEEHGLIQTELIYEGNKIRRLKPRILFVTKNPQFRTSIQKFFQGLWVDGEANQKVVAFLKAHPEDYFSAEEIAAKTGLTIDQVELVLSNWESQVSRALSDFLKKKPFEKKVLYKGLAD